MAKTYIVKWYDWQASHYKEKECKGEQLNQLFSTFNNKKRHFRHYHNGG